jgi:hypothetical protein
MKPKTKLKATVLIPHSLDDPALKVYAIASAAASPIGLPAQSRQALTGRCGQVHY